MNSLPTHAADLPYLREVFVLLAAALVVVVALHRLKLSPVLGYLAAGVVIGPYGLSVIERSEEVQLFGELGVVFLLFLIGLELAWPRLKTMHRLIFGLGSLQVIVTGLAIGLIAWAWGNAPETALVVGFALALSSTAVVVQVLVERGEIASHVGRVGFSVLIFQDLAVVPLLVLVPALAPAADGAPAATFEALLLAILKAVMAIAAILFAGRFLLRLPFRWVATTRSSELFVALVLLVVLGTAWLTQQFGLSMALGAFLAGLALAETEYRHQVETDIKPFKGLLLGLFFISVGMSIDLALILDHAAWILASVAGLVAVKAAILTGLGIAFRLPRSVAAHVGLLLAEGGEFAFIVVAAAMAAGIVPDATAHFMFAVAGLSIMATPALAVVGGWVSRRIEKSRAERELAGGEAPIPPLENHVVIAGFGRVGQTIATMLDAQQVPYMAIDHDVKVVRAFAQRPHGRAVYYGDATRRDLLERLGATQAAAFVITLDDRDAVRRAVRAIAAAWPDAKLLVRAHDASELAELKASGASEVIPETFESSLALARHALRAIGAPTSADATFDDGKSRSSVKSH